MISNEYLDHYNNELASQLADPARSHLVWNNCPMRLPFDKKMTDIRNHYAYAIPTDDALNTITEYSPNGIVEIGAGGGYWAMLLRERHVDVVAYDIKPQPNFYHDTNWSAVEQGNHTKARKHSDRTLFLCWPPYNDPCAADSLKSYRGRTIVYIGEGDGGCTGDDEFHKLLDRRFEQFVKCSIPQWFGLHDRLVVYCRKQRRVRAVKTQ